MCERIVEDITAAPRGPAVGEPVEADGYPVAAGTSVEHGDFQRAGIARWRRLARAARNILD